MVTATGSVPSVGVRCGDPYGLLYQSLRGVVLARGGGRCVFCGLASAVETHHSALVYPCGSDRSCCGRAKVGAGDLVGFVLAVSSVGYHVASFLSGGRRRVCVRGPV